MTRSKILLLAAALVSGATLSPVHFARAQTKAPAASMSEKPSRADSDALKEMAQANLAEVAAGKMALEKAQDAKVKAFAQMMVDDHSTGLKDVQQVAQSKGVTLPTEPDRSQKAQADALSKLSGAEFDRQYIAKAGVADHKQVHDKLQKISKSAKDTDVKELAGKMLPVVERHLEHAQGMSRGSNKAS